MPFCFHLSMCPFKEHFSLYVLLSLSLRSLFFCHTQTHKQAQPRPLVGHTVTQKSYCTVRFSLTRSHCIPHAIFPQTMPLHSRAVAGAVCGIIRFRHWFHPSQTLLYLLSSHKGTPWTFLTTSGTMEKCVDEQVSLFFMDCALLLHKLMGNMKHIPVSGFTQFH